MSLMEETIENETWVHMKKEDFEDAKADSYNKGFNDGYYYRGKEDREQGGGSDE